MFYLVGTPIGNLDDLSIRQAKTLASVEIILAEDTRSAGILLPKIEEKFSLVRNKNQRFISYYKDIEFEKLPEVLKLLEENKEVSLISESGLPLISDPGSLLVKTLIRKNISFTVIPGSTALTTALVYSGFNTNKFCFLGFLPKKSSQLLHYINIMKSLKDVDQELSIVVYESPIRINKTLEVIGKIMPETHLCIARELTKKFEEIVRGKAVELAKRTYKGEIVLIIN